MSFYSLVFSAERSREKMLTYANIALLILFVLILISFDKIERFGETINKSPIGQEREYPVIFTSGATMRVLGQSFSGTDQ